MPKTESIQGKSMKNCFSEHFAMAPRLVASYLEGKLVEAFIDDNWVRIPDYIEPNDIYRLADPGLRYRTTTEPNIHYYEVDFDTLTLATSKALPGDFHNLKVFRDPQSGKVVDVVYVC